MNNKTLLIVLIILIGAFSRIIPHPPNFTPIGAISILGGLYFGKKYLAFIIPFMAMLVSDIILGYKKYLNGKYDSLISGYITKKFFWKNIKKGIKPINYNPSKRPMRQTNKGTIVENGAFYFFRTNGFFKKKNRIFGRTGVYLMDEKNSIDIDTKSDFEQAKKILNRGK